MLLLTLPTCRWRGPEITSGRYMCASPNVVAGNGVPVATCARCPYQDHAGTPPRFFALAPQFDSSGLHTVGTERRSLPLVRPPCVHEGPIPVGRECPLGHEDLHGHLCDKDYDEAKGFVTRRDDCARCPDYWAQPAALRRFEWIGTAQLAKDSALLAGQFLPDVAAIAGVPRSGMIPASIIATLLQLPLYELTEEGELRKLGHGSRGRNLGFAGGDGPTVVIDDTVYGGGAMAKARTAMMRLQKRAVFAAVYVRPDRLHLVDHYVRALPSPHLLEWNLTNNGPFTGHAANPVYGAGIACDFDGIFCEDFRGNENSDEQYRWFLANAKPLLVPRKVPVRLIVTGRLERWRPETEAWLKRWGVKWDRLAMFAGTREARDGGAGHRENVARFKAREFAASQCGFFCESDAAQAEIIFRLTGKPVICPAAGTIFQ